MKLLCDTMLARLGRWLRAAGHDTRIAEGREDDRALLDLALAEERLLLTRDRRIAESKRAAGRLFILTSGRVPEQAAELSRGLAIDWLRDPFSRCVVDNAVLRDALPAQTDALPEKARALGGKVASCPACGRVYWEGSHHRRMRARLESWQSAGR